VTIFRPILGAAAAFALLAVPGTAQIVGGELRNYDSSAPIDFSADRIEVREQQNEALFTGSVSVSQGTLDLTAASVRVLYSSAGTLSVNELVADGGVTVRTPAESARAQRAIYDVRRSLVTLLGDVRLVRGGDTLSGDRLVIDLGSGRSSIAGTTQGGRVTGRFQPNSGG
jgi:lipopolysaccharide export system protein LptA